MGHLKATRRQMPSQVITFYASSWTQRWSNRAGLGTMAMRWHGSATIAGWITKPARMSHLKIKAPMAAQIMLRSVHVSRLIQARQPTWNSGRMAAGHCISAVSQLQVAMSPLVKAAPRFPASIQRIRLGTILPFRQQAIPSRLPLMAKRLLMARSRLSFPDELL